MFLNFSATPWYNQILKQMRYGVRNLERRQKGEIEGERRKERMVRAGGGVLFLKKIKGVVTLPKIIGEELSRANI